MTGCHHHMYRAGSWSSPPEKCLQDSRGGSGDETVPALSSLAWFESQDESQALDSGAVAPQTPSAASGLPWDADPSIQMKYW
jgi:hypothetical protein